MENLQPARFDMPGARAVHEHLGRPAQLGFILDALERAVIENPSMAVDFAKSVVETTCKSLCRERGVSTTDTMDIQKLVRTTTDSLQMTPSGHMKPSELRRGLSKAVSGLSTMVQGLAEIRNIEGPISHGKDSDWTPIGRAQAELVARAADGVVNFLYLAHLGQAAKPGVPPLRYEDNPEFNEYVDEANGDIDVFGLVYRPSEVLFTMDREAYRSQLAFYVEEQATAVAVSPEPATKQSA